MGIIKWSSSNRGTGAQIHSEALSPFSKPTTLSIVLWKKSKQNTQRPLVVEVTLCPYPEGQLRNAFRSQCSVLGYHISWKLMAKKQTKNHLPFLASMVLPGWAGEAESALQKASWRGFGKAAGTCEQLEGSFQELSLIVLWTLGIRDGEEGFRWPFANTSQPAAYPLLLYLHYFIYTWFLQNWEKCLSFTDFSSWARTGRERPLSSWQSWVQLTCLGCNNANPVHLCPSCLSCESSPYYCGSSLLYVRRPYMPHDTWLFGTFGSTSVIYKSHFLYQNKKHIASV